MTIVLDNSLRNDSGQLPVLRRDSSLVDDIELIQISLGQIEFVAISHSREHLDDNRGDDGVCPLVLDEPLGPIPRVLRSLLGQGRNPLERCNEE